MSRCQNGTPSLRAVATSAIWVPRPCAQALVEDLRRARRADGHPGRLAEHVPNDFSSTFTITSTAGTVTGSKSLGENGIALCTPGSGPVLVSTVGLTATYSATINGAQRTAGTATVSIEGVLGSGTPVFSENFASAGAVQLTSKEQCRGGGWQSTSSASSPGPRDADGRTAGKRSTPTPLPRIHSGPFSGPTDCPLPRSVSSGYRGEMVRLRDPARAGARTTSSRWAEGEGEEENPGA